MTLKFRACVGPSTERCHIRCDGETLTLCQRTVPARDVDGVVDHNIICVPCLKGMAARLETDKFMSCEYLCELLGLDKII